MRDRLMVGRQVLALVILVRIQVPQPTATFYIKSGKICEKT